MEVPRRVPSCRTSSTPSWAQGGSNFSRLGGRLAGGVRHGGQEVCRQSARAARVSLSRLFLDALEAYPLDVASSSWEAARPRPVLMDIKTSPRVEACPTALARTSSFRSPFHLSMLDRLARTHSLPDDPPPCGQQDLLEQGIDFETSKTGA